MQRRITLGFLFSLLVIVALSSPGTPQSSAQTNTVNQYAAKFVCGKSKGPLAAPGEYYTMINVHNPSTDPTIKGTVKLKKKFALGEKDEHVGEISSFCETTIKPDGVMGIDCPNIYKHLGVPEGTFIEGFAVIQTKAELDIVSVYTAGHDQVEAFHTERVPFRKVPVFPEVCSDLNLSINTGSTHWEIVVDPLSGTTEPRPASVVTVSPSWPQLTTSTWVGPFANAGLVPASSGDYIYDFTFCLCPGFSNPKLELKGLADDRGRVSLNGLPLAPTLGHVLPAGVIATNAGFITGNNTLRVVVSNSTNSITGLNINGSITATAGRCGVDACEQ